MAFIVVYDACVLYPANVRDLLMEVAISDLVQAKWTSQIQEEWARSLRKDRPDIDQEGIARTQALMNAAIPDVLVENYQPLISSVELPDPDDRHVVAAAIRSGAQMIVTFNEKDFPSGLLDAWGVEAMHPDRFLEHQFGLHEAAVVACAKRIRARLKDPTMSVSEYLDRLASCGLPVTADKLREFEALI